MTARPRGHARRLAVALTAAGAVAIGALVPLAAPGAPSAEAAGSSLRLWYDESATEGSRISSGGPFRTTTENEIWQQRTLPIGNGSLGATVYGEVGRDRLAFNEKTLWTGGPSSSRPDYNGGNLSERGRDGAALREVQSLFAQGQAAQARAVANRDLIGGMAGYGAYEGYAEIGLDFGIAREAASGYSRALDLETGIATVSFSAGGVDYVREYFVSFPDNVLVMRLTASRPGAIDVGLGIDFRRHDPVDVVAEGDALTVSGALSDNQLQHNAALRAVPTGGTMRADGEQLRIDDADEVTVFLSAGTDYDDVYPAYRTGQTAAELAAQVASRVGLAVDAGYEQVRERHLADYDELFGRVDLSLGALSADATDDLLARYRAGTATDQEKRTLEVVLYQYGRYLAIASSREGALPANLQGIWSDRYSGGPSPVPWSSDYHMNVNLQMNYWPSYSANLSETATPLIDYVESLRAPGRETARIYAGVESTPENPENGFTAHTQNTPFGWTTPGWNFSWGWSPGAVPWILQNVYESYEYSGDETYLREAIYPMLKESARYFDQTLVENPATGRLVTSPAYSPEHGPITDGNFYEQQLLWQLYEDASHAATVLGLDADLVAAWKQTQARLRPVEVGASGQIKEWFEETTLGSVPQTERQHRHLSQMLGLFPGDLITPDRPDLIDAARVSMNDRGDNATGWGIAQCINTWARIGDGDRSLRLIEQLFRTGIYANLFDAHPPFQIDGNFGYTSAVNEMLLQSNAGYLNLLPALPAGWKEGSISGLRARGGFEASLSWSDRSVGEVRVTSMAGSELVVDYPGLSSATVRTEEGERVQPEVRGTDRIAFPTQAGRTYVITGVADLPPPAPQGGRGLRVSADEVRLSWDAATGAQDVQYVVERRLDDGEFARIAEGLTEPSFVDGDAPESAGTYSYRISAVQRGSTSAPGAPFGVNDARGAGIIDDRDPRITFTGGWGTWNDARHLNGTIRFIERTTGGERISLTFVGTAVSFISPKNSNFTSVEFFIDGERVEGDPYDLYAPGYTVQQERVIAEGLEPGLHTVEVAATGSRSPNGGTKIEFDAFRVTDGG